MSCLAHSFWQYVSSCISSYPHIRIHSNLVKLLIHLACGGLWSCLCLFSKGVRNRTAKSYIEQQFFYIKATIASVGEPSSFIREVWHISTPKKKNKQTKKTKYQYNNSAVTCMRCRVIKTVYQSHHMYMSMRVNHLDLSCR